MARLVVYVLLLAVALLVIRTIAPVIVVALAGLLLLAWKRPAIVTALAGRPLLASVPGVVRATPMRFAATTAVVGLALVGATSAVGREGEPAASAAAQENSQQAEVAAATATPTPTQEPTPRATARPTAKPTPRPTATPAALTTASGPSGPTEVGTVVDVTDGDTIKVDIGGVIYPVRYIGIDTPEVHSGVEWLGPEAEAANAALVAGQTVVLEKDVSETDRFGRLLRYVWIDADGGWLLVNLELLRLGVAQVTTFPPDVKYADTLYLEAQREARTSELGLWGTSPVVQTPAPVVRATAAPVVRATPAPVVVAATPVPFVAPAPVVVVTPAPVVAAPAPSGCEPSYPDICIPIGVADINCPAMYAQGISMFRVRWDVPNPDPHGFDGEGDGWGCEG